MPKVAALVYGNLAQGLPYVFALAGSSGGKVPASAAANTKPLHTAIAYLAPDADGLKLSGFTGIK